MDYDKVTKQLDKAIQMFISQMQEWENDEKHIKEQLQIILDDNIRFSLGGE